MVYAQCSSAVSNVNSICQKLHRVRNLRDHKIRMLFSPSVVEPAISPWEMEPDLGAAHRQFFQEGKYVGRNKFMNLRVVLRKLCIEVVEDNRCSVVVLVALSWIRLLLFWGSQLSGSW